MTIESFLPAKTRLYVSEMAGGPSKIGVFDLKADACRLFPPDVCLPSISV